MAVNPTGTQAENDAAAAGNTVVAKLPDGAPLDPNTPPFMQGLPANLTLPVITGTLTVGSVLQCSTGTWNYSGGLTYTYQWLRAGANISGANSSNYTVTTPDKTFTLSCKVSAVNSKGTTSATSASTATVP